MGLQLHVEVFDFFLMLDLHRQVSNQKGKSSQVFDTKIYVFIKYRANTSEFSFRIFVGISFSCVIFAVFNS